MGNQENLFNKTVLLSTQNLFYLMDKRIVTRIFLVLIWGRISAPSQFKHKQKLPRMVFIIHNFLVLHFGENFMKIRTKKAKLQMHENLQKNVNENMFKQLFMSFYEVKLKQRICYSFILLISHMVFNPI